MTMIFLTDTCFWSHAKELHDAGILDVRLFFHEWRWGITQEIEKEIRHRGLTTFVELDKAYMIPVQRQDIESLQHEYPAVKELDLADQALIVAGSRENAVMLTDDGGLLLACQFHGIPALNLPLLCVTLVERGTATSRILNRCIRQWETTGRYSKDWINRLKAWKQRGLPFESDTGSQ